MTTKTKATEAVEIIKVERGQFSVCILGKTPLIHNRMSQKVWRELLAPKGRKTAAEKASTMKHDPLTEFGNSPYLLADSKEPTYLAIMPSAFKRAMQSAALDMPGAKKAQIGRLVNIEGEMIGIYGVPKLRMDITRSADINRTPDVRTRACCEEWACKLTISYTKPILREQAIINLLYAAGFQSGIGDWRQEKGSANYGCFEIVSSANTEFQRIVKTQGRAAQKSAMKNPVAYNSEAEEMLAWFDVELKRRGFKVAA